jgi:serine/threonine protein phosphatase PrpC
MKIQKAKVETAPETIPVGQTPPEVTPPILQTTPLFDYTFEAASLVDIGRRRMSNQDSVLFQPDDGLFAVSDGMGGLKNGGDASKIATETFPDLLDSATAKLKKTLTPQTAAELLTAQLGHLSDELYTNTHSGKDISHGATFSGVWLIKKRAVFVNLGDSRGYILSAGRLSRFRQITLDHNYAATLVRLGEITKEEARKHPSSSYLESFVGMPPPAEPETFIEALTPGTQILLCSDGLHNMLPESEIEKILRSGKNPSDTCRQLIDEANANGGRDNIAVINIQITGEK